MGPHRHRTCQHFYLGFPAFRIVSNKFLLLTSHPVCPQICQKIWKTQQWPQDLSVFIAIPKKGNAKECSNYCTIALISDASKVMLKILQARLQQYMNQEIPEPQIQPIADGNIGKIPWPVESREAWPAAREGWPYVILSKMHLHICFYHNIDFALNLFELNILFLVLDVLFSFFHSV